MAQRSGAKPFSYPSGYEAGQNWVKPGVSYPSGYETGEKQEK
ncbi:hypothetical protein ABIE53_002142 [Burkholderia sp. OAS925]